MIAVPDVGSTRVVQMPIVVVFPAPLEPEELAVFYLEVERLERDDFAPAPSIGRSARCVGR
jgi:hypothetical protein